MHDMGVTCRAARRRPRGRRGSFELEPPILQRAIELFNAGRYFECHEVLEEPWLAAAEPERRFLKGLIHAAVSLHHYQRGNAHGARVKASSARGYLESFLPVHAGIDLQALLAELERFMAPLDRWPPRAPVPPPAAPWPRIRRRRGR
jgi:uncharacterized protein